jgi:hypothetical protein
MNNQIPQNNIGLTEIQLDHLTIRTLDFLSDFDKLLEKEQILSNLYFDLHQNDEFTNECKNIKRDYKKFDTVLDKFIQSGYKRVALIETFNNYIGFSIPSENIISIIYDTYVNHQRLYPNAKLVDLGTGSGIYPWLLNRKGINKDNLVAVDLPFEEISQKFDLIYWDNIIRNKSYTPNSDDMVFISWGYGRYDSFDRYLLSGGKCVIIIGEQLGSTLHVDFFAINWHIFTGSENNIENIDYVKNMYQNLRLASGIYMRGNIPPDNLKILLKGWNTKMYAIDTVSVISQDYLSINTKYNQHSDLQK